MGAFITGIGIVSCIGNSVNENFDNLSDTKSGIISKDFIGVNRSVRVGEVKLSNSELKQELGISGGFVSRTVLLALKAAREAWGDQSINQGHKTGVISATSVGGMDGTETFYLDEAQGKRGNQDVFLTHESGCSASAIAKELGIDGYVNTLSTACSSGTNAMILGERLLSSGQLDRVIVGGTDALCAFTINGFSSLMIYDEDWCRPFDNSRKGLNLGEGAAYLVLESEKSLTKTGNRPIAVYSGGANASDAYHQTASSPDGKGATIAMSSALEMAKLRPEDVGYVNAHGTATPNNDQSESVALINVFGDFVPDFSSTKAFTGHTLAAAGAIEAVYSVLALNNQCCFPNLNFRTPIEGPNLTPLTRLKNKPLKHVLSNSFGFGGNNSSIVISAV